MAAPSLMMFGCGACKERFTTREEMKQHFATPFHAFNAERKAKGFTPVDYATYKALEPDDDDQQDRTPKFYCKICNKYYKSVQTLTMHLKSNQHVANKQKAIEDGASTVHSTASKFLLGSKYVSSKPLPKHKKGQEGDAPGIAPTPVLLIKDAPNDMTEADVHNTLEPFGQVDRVLFIRKRWQVLVQMPSVAAAATVLEGCPEGMLKFQDMRLPIQYSARESLGQDCQFCHQPGHTEEHCFVKARSCNYCRQEGHKRKFCPKLPCVSCGSSMHTLQDCEHREHYNTVLQEIRKVENEMHVIVERAKQSTEESADAPTDTIADMPQASEEDRKRRDWLQSCICLFCDEVALSPQESARHMRDRHHFQLPMPDLIQDLYGLMSYLQRKIRAGLCLWCGERTKYFADIKSLRTHMTHMGHRNINWTDNVDEYADFYNLPDSTAWVPEADTEGRFELPNGRVISSRNARTPHEHVPGEYLMAGKESDLDRRQLLLAYKTHGALATNAAKKNLSASQYQQLVRQDIAIHNKRNKEWLKLAVDHNRAQFRGFTVMVSKK